MDRLDGDRRDVPQPLGLAAEGVVIDERLAALGEVSAPPAATTTAEANTPICRSRPTSRSTC